MNRMHRRIAVLAPIASVALLAGCSDHMVSTHSSAAPVGNVHSPAGPADSTLASASRPANSESPVAPDVPTPTPSARRPEFRSTVVYGLVKSVTVTGSGARLVWDKGDWQFNVGDVDPATLPSCEKYDHGDILSNCNSRLRTTDIPADASIKLVFPGCPAGGPDIDPDPRHPGRALGKQPVSIAKLATLSHTVCQPDYPAPAFGGVWLTFDGSGKLTDITEKFES